MEIITTQQITTARSVVSDTIVVDYTAERKNDNPVERIGGRILKNGNAVGYFNANQAGESGLTFVANAPLTVEEKREIAAKIYADEAALLNPESESEPEPEE
jgi:hypothetical protein